jgi:hypothetical protein
MLLKNTYFKWLLLLGERFSSYFWLGVAAWWRTQRWDCHAAHASEAHTPPGPSKPSAIVLRFCTMAALDKGFEIAPPGKTVELAAVSAQGPGGASGLDEDGREQDSESRRHEDVSSETMLRQVGRSVVVQLAARWVGMFSSAADPELSRPGPATPVTPYEVTIKGRSS